MSGVDEQLLRRLLEHKERLRAAVYAIAGHPETPDRVRVIATTALDDIGEPLPPEATARGFEATRRAWAESEDDR